MNIEEQNLNEPQRPQLNIGAVSCSVCGGHDILHEEKTGRGLQPKSYKPHPLIPKPKILWKGTWDVWTCKSCGETWRKLSR